MCILQKNHRTNFLKKNYVITKNAGKTLVNMSDPVSKLMNFMIFQRKQKKKSSTSVCYLYKIIWGALFVGKSGGFSMICAGIDDKHQSQ